MGQTRASHRHFVAGTASALLILTCVLSPVLAQEAPAEKETAPPVQRPGGGLGNLFQRMLQQIWEPPEQPVPRVRAGDNVTAERTNGPQDAIDARAPRNPKLDGLWTASNTAVRQNDWKRAAELLQRILDSPEDAVYRAKGGRWGKSRILRTPPRARDPDHVTEGEKPAIPAPGTRRLMPHTHGTCEFVIRRCTLAACAARRGL